MANSVHSQSSDGLFSSIFMKIVTSPLNIALVGIIIFLVYRIFKSMKRFPVEEPKLPKLRRDFTVQELRKYDGTGPDGRILVAVNGKVFDVTVGGKRFYGPKGPYSVFGGRDASRSLGKFSFELAENQDEYDDLSDLNAMEMESVREWEFQFKEKYEYVGKLLKPGEQPTNYSDEEEEVNSSTETDKGKEAEGDAGKVKFE